MKKKGLAMLFFSIMISALVLIILFLGLLYAFPHWFRFSSDLVSGVITLLFIVIVVKGFIGVFLLAKEKNSQYQYLLNEKKNLNTCPHCNVNITSDCQCCPNCKKEIQR